MDDEGQKMFQVYDNACGKIIISLKNKLVNYVTKNGGRKTLVACFQAIKMDIDDNFEPNKCEDVVKKSLIDSPIFQKCVVEELKKLGIKYNV